MKKYAYITSILMCMAACMASCSDEEGLTPSHADINGFEAAKDDNSQTAQLRRQFYENTGCYLLFSDTLSTNGSGGPELLDIGYQMFGSGDDADYNYTYIVDEEERKMAAECVQKYLVSRLGKMVPFSILLVNSISYLDYGYWENTDKVLGSRAYAISMSDGEAYEDPEGYFGSMLKDIMKNVFEKNDDLLADFYAFSDYYYNKDFSDLDIEEFTQEDVYNIGMFYFIESSSWGNYFYNKKKDIDLWLDAVMTQTEEEFAEEYGEYDTMMKKYRVFANIIKELGFVINN